MKKTILSLFNTIIIFLIFPNIASAQNRYTPPDLHRTVGVLVLPFHDLTGKGELSAMWHDAMLASVSKNNAELRLQTRYKMFNCRTEFDSSTHINAVVEVAIHRIAIETANDVKFPSPSSWMIKNDTAYKYASSHFLRTTKTVTIEGIATLLDYTTCNHIWTRKIKASALNDTGKFNIEGDRSLVPLAYGGLRQESTRPRHNKAIPVGRPAFQMTDDYVMAKAVGEFTAELFRTLMKHYMSPELRRWKHQK